VTQQSRSQVQAVDPSDEGGTILPLLLENLDDLNPRARVLAVREVADYTDEIVITRLLELAERDPDLEVRCASISAMGNYIYLGGVDCFDPESELDPAFFEDCLSEPDFERVYDLLLAISGDEKRTLDERRYAVESLSFAHGEPIERLILDLYNRPEQKAKISALYAMGCNGAARWEEILLAAFSNPDRDIQIEAVSAAGEMGADSLGKDIWRMTYADDKDLVLTAIWALGQTGWEGAFDRLDELTLADDPQIRQCADEAMDEWLFFNGMAEEHGLDESDRFLDDE
jgi:hypothetical protein